MDLLLAFIVIVLIVAVALVLSKMTHRHTTAPSYGYSSGTGHATITCVSDCGTRPTSYHCEGGDSGMVCNPSTSKWECTKCDSSHEGNPALGCLCTISQGAPTAEKICQSDPMLMVCQDSGTYSPVTATNCAAVTSNLQRYGITDPISTYCKSSMNCSSSETPRCIDDGPPVPPPGPPVSCGACYIHSADGASCSLCPSCTHPNSDQTQCITGCNASCSQCAGGRGCEPNGTCKYC